MAGKVKGGLGKTARSSTVFKRPDPATPHACTAGCGRPITQKNLIVVRLLPARRMTFWHRECYQLHAPPGVPPGKNGVNMDVVKASSPRVYRKSRGYLQAWPSQ